MYLNTGPKVKTCNKGKYRDKKKQTSKKKTGYIFESNTRTFLVLGLWFVLFYIMDMQRHTEKNWLGNEKSKYQTSQRWKRIWVYDTN